ncbi:MAG TPA: alpha/beta hydrolase [Solirubrobacteraceae bacterium]
MSGVEQVASADGTPIAYRAIGSGEPLLMVHGSGTASGDWTFALPFLRERFTVVTMDRRGRGRSGDAPDYAMEREAEDILAVRDAVDAELLVAHSYGALCAMLAAERTNRLRRLVLYEPPIAVKKDRVPGVEQLIAAGDLDAAVEGFLRAAGAPPAQLEAIRSSPAWPLLRDAMPALPRELRAASAWRPPREPLDVPTLLLLGADTTGSVYVDGLDEVEAAFTNVRRELIPGQQHIAHVFAAEAFAQLVADFCG